MLRVPRRRYYNTGTQSWDTPIPSYINLNRYSLLLRGLGMTGKRMCKEDAQIAYLECLSTALNIFTTDLLTGG